MHLLRGIYRTYLDASIHVGLAAGCLLATTQIRYDQEISYTLCCFIVAATVLAYNIVKHTEKNSLKLHKLTSTAGIINMIAAWCVLGLLNWIYLEQILFMALGLVLTAFYARPILGKDNLRSKPIIKPIIVAMVWAITTFIVPLYASWEWEWTAGLIARILFVFALTMPFEIRDLQHDRRELGTLPQIYGVTKTKWIATLCLLLAALLELFNATGHIRIVLLIYTLTLILIWLTPKSNNENYVSFWVEAVPIAWLALEIFWR